MPIGKILVCVLFLIMASSLDVAKLMRKHI